MQPSSFRLVFGLQVLMVIFDIFVNSFALNFRSTQQHTALALYIVQGVVLLVAFFILILELCSTYALQAGLLKGVFHKFRAALVATFIYFLLTVGVDAWGLSEAWDMGQQSDIWTAGFHTLFSIQRLASILFYYLYLRASLRLGDPRLYTNSTWLQREFAK